MRRTRRFGPAAAGVLALLAAGCGGGGEQAATTTSITAATTSTTAATAAPVATTAPTGPSTTATTRPHRATVVPPVTTVPTTRAAAAAGGAFTPPGTYRYRSTGTFTSTLTGTQDRTGEATLTVDPPAGTDQRSVRQGLGRTTEQVLRVDAAGASLVSLHLVDTGVDKQVRPSPPALALPAGVAPGRTWSWRATSTDGLTTVDSSFRAVRTEEVVVGDDRVAALVVDVTLTFSGDVASTSHQTMWVDTARRLVVRQDESTQGRFGLVTFSSRTSDTLLALAPG